MVSDEAGFERAKMIQPEVMAPPLVWLVSDAAGKVTGRRFPAVHWDPALPPEQAAEKGWSAGRLDQHCYDADHAACNTTQVALSDRRHEITGHMGFGGFLINPCVHGTQPRVSGSR
jgi:hypothetical protein